ncbi:hypothetical protein AB0E69_04540 [Kribbella sp. NPDC026611]|uniref:hypothetical protein n=1 Tax=Kribbella sp. NPDC026611 TaxID=3154911 RepID=UPI0033DF7198
MTFEFDLVAGGSELRFTERGFEQIRFLLSEFQPATRVTVEGEPPTRIRVQAQGRPTIMAPGLLAQVEKLAGTTLRFELRT